MKKNPRVFHMFSNLVTEWHARFYEMYWNLAHLKIKGCLETTGEDRQLLQEFTSLWKQAGQKGCAWEHVEHSPLIPIGGSKIFATVFLGVPWNQLIPLEITLISSEKHPVLHVSILPEYAWPNEYFPCLNEYGSPCHIMDVLQNYVLTKKN